MAIYLLRNLPEVFTLVFENIMEREIWIGFYEIPILITLGTSVYFKLKLHGTSVVSILDN